MITTQAINKWAVGVVVSASDFKAKGCEFDFHPGQIIVRWAGVFLLCLVCQLSILVCI